MLSGEVKRIRRSRPIKAVPKIPDLDDDEFWDIPRWDEEEDVRSSATLGEAVEADDIAGIADAISKRWYPQNSDPEWPKHFLSKAQSMKGDRRHASRVAWALMHALTTQLIGHLPDLQLKVMLFILNRTWGWKKPREGIPYSHFQGGVFVKGQQIHSPVAKSPEHLHDACKRLESMGLIRITVAKSDHGNVNIFEINVRGVMKLMQEIQRTARRLPLPRRRLRARQESDLYP